MDIYLRTEITTVVGEAPVVTAVPVKEAMAEVNHAMMAGKREVRTMSSSRGYHSIAYKDGRKVQLTLTDTSDARIVAALGRMEEAAATREEDPQTWSVASHRNLLHRFTEATGDGRALCNKRFRPWKFANGHDFQTRADRDASQYGYLYSYCPKCESK